MGETCSVCGIALTGGDVLYAPDGRIVCPKHFAELDPSAGGARSPWRMSAIAGGIAGAIPFAIHMSSSSMSSVNGHVTSFVYRDWIAVICGVIAAVLGVMTLLASRKEQLQRALALAAGVGVLALGGLQIARGLGVFASPDNGADSSSSTSISVEHSPDPQPAAPAVDPAPAPAPAPAVPAAPCADAKSCFEEGRQRRAGGDGAGAMVSFQSACDKGNQDGCSEVGYGYSEGQGVAKDPAKAKDIYEKVCAAGHAFSCVRLGIMYFDGDGMKADHKKAFELFVKSCDVATDADGGTGCDRASEMLHDGDGVKADQKRAAALLEKACKLDSTYCKDAAPK